MDKKLQSLTFQFFQCLNFKEKVKKKKKLVRLNFFKL